MLEKTWWPIQRQEIDMFTLPAYSSPSSASVLVGISPKHANTSQPILAVPDLGYDDMIQKVHVCNNTKVFIVFQTCHCHHQLPQPKSLPNPFERSFQPHPPLAAIAFSLREGSRGWWWCCSSHVCFEDVKMWRLLCEQILPSASSATAARGRQSQDWFDSRGPTMQNAQAFKNGLALYTRLAHKATRKSLRFVRKQHLGFPSLPYNISSFPILSIAIIGFQIFLLPICFAQVSFLVVKNIKKHARTHTHTVPGWSLLTHQPIFDNPGIASMSVTIITKKHRKNQQKHIFLILFGNCEDLHLNFQTTRQIRNINSIPRANLPKVVDVCAQKPDFYGQALSNGVMWATRWEPNKFNRFMRWQHAISPVSLQLS